MTTDERDERAALFEKARRALDAARTALDGGDAETAVNRAFYATLHAARAALLADGERPKSHSGVLTRFAFHFGRTRRLPAEVVRVIADAYDARLRTDYDAFTVFDTDAAADLVRDAGEFVAAVEALARNPGA